MTFLTRRMAIESYALLSGGVLAASLLVVRSARFASEPEILSWAVSCDIALILPACYLLLARRMVWPAVSVIPVFFLSLFAARAVLPAGQNGILPVAWLAAAPLELAALLFVLHKARQIRREVRAGQAGSLPFVEALEAALVRALGSEKTARLVMTEACVIHYALFAWRQKAARPRGALSFTYHVESRYGAVVGVFAFMILVETSLLHILLALWAPWPAWTLSALSLYGILFLLADFNAARLRPIVIGERTLSLNLGLRWRATISREEIESVETLEGELARDRRTLKAVLIGKPNLILRLRTPHTAIGLYGFTKDFDRIAVGVDDVDGFRRGLS